MARREKLAVNLFDLERLSTEQFCHLLKDRLDLQHVIKTDFDRQPGGEEAAVAFTCDLLEAAIICDLIRSDDRKAGDFPTRLYLKREKWSRIPSHVALTTCINGDKPALNEKVFQSETTFVQLTSEVERL